jgi:hypothetical protein
MSRGATLLEDPGAVLYLSFRRQGGSAGREVLEMKNRHRGWG